MKRIAGAAAALWLTAIAILAFSKLTVSNDPALNIAGLCIGASIGLMATICWCYVIKPFEI